MEKRILAYRRFIDEKIMEIVEDSEKKDGKRRWNKEEIRRLQQEHLVQIGFFQHERLVHLIVTVLFAVLEFLSLILVPLMEELLIVLLPLLVLMLLVPYIRHYYILENEVQKMYRQYDKITCMLTDSDANITFSDNP